MIEKNTRKIKIDNADYTESREVEYKKEKNRFLNLSPKNYLRSTSGLSTKKSLIPIMLISIMDRDNKIYMSLDELSKILEYPNTGLSVLFKEYRKSDFMIKIRNGVYMINPLVSYRGSKYERDKLLREYEKYKEK